MGKKRERSIKLALVVFWIFIALIIVSALILTGIVHFEWSDKIIHNYRYQKNKSKDSRILVIGDSQLEKWPIPHCLNSDIEKFCTDNNIGLLNAAHHGFGPIEYLDLVKKHTPDFKPQLIIIFYYAGNDLTDVMYRSDNTPTIPTHDVWRVIPGENDPKPYPATTQTDIPRESKITEAEKIKILRESEFDWKSFREKGVDTTMIRYAQNRVLNPNKIGPEYVNPHVLVMGTWQPDYLFDNNMIDSPASKNTWFKIIKIFEEIAKYASSTNTNLAIITIPSTVQVDSSHFDFYRKTLYNVSRELLTTDKPQQLLKEFTSKAEIPYLDLLPYFKKTPNTSALYFENDDHLSNEGHLLAYKLVEEQMLQPFIKGQLPMFNVIGIKNFHKKYTGWAVEFAAQKIRENEAWFNAVKLKAVEQNIPLDSMIMMDARYVVENDL